MFSCFVCCYKSWKKMCYKQLKTKFSVYVHSIIIIHNICVGLTLCTKFALPAKAFFQLNSLSFFFSRSVDAVCDIITSYRCTVYMCLFIHFHLNKRTLHRDWLYLPSLSISKHNRVQSIYQNWNIKSRYQHPSHIQWIFKLSYAAIHPLFAATLKIKSNIYEKTNGRKENLRAKLIVTFSVVSNIFIVEWESC